jgi:hypothetical protein
MPKVTIPLPKNTTDETGHRYGRLVALEYAGEQSHSAMWLCQCDCGQQPIVRGAKLRSGRVVSCGCWRADHDVRQAARMQTPVRRRKQIAKMGGAARKAVRSLTTE